MTCFLLCTTHDTRLDECRKIHFIYCFKYVVAVNCFSPVKTFLKCWYQIFFPFIVIYNHHPPTSPKKRNINRKIKVEQNKLEHLSIKPQYEWMTFCRKAGGDPWWKCPPEADAFLFLAESRGCGLTWLQRAGDCAHVLISWCAAAAI